MVGGFTIALDRLHDAKGPSGMNPYEVLFGRPRALANKPYEPEKKCEDAIEFFARMKALDEILANAINEEHEKKAERANRGLGKPTPFAPGDVAWYRRPENSGGPLDSRWLGPVEIVSRTGDNSYEIRVKPGKVMGANRCDLKPYVPDKYNKDPVPLFFHRRTVIDDDALPDEFEVVRILDHRINKKGDVEFLTHWKGGTEHDATWEPVNSFFHRYSSDFVDYCFRANYEPQILKYLSRKPHDE